MQHVQAMPEHACLGASCNSPSMTIHSPPLLLHPPTPAPHTPHPTPRLPDSSNDAAIENSGLLQHLCARICLVFFIKPLVPGYHRAAASPPLDVAQVAVALEVELLACGEGLLQRDLVKFMPLQDLLRHDAQIAGLLQ